VTSVNEQKWAFRDGRYAGLADGRRFGFAFGLVIGILIGHFAW